MTMPVQPPIKSPSKPPDNVERFRAEMPQIPGVGSTRPSASASADDAIANRRLQVGGLSAAVLVAGIAILWWAKSATYGGSKPASSETAESSPPAPPPVDAGPTITIPEGPTLAATTEELAKPWSMKKFTFVRPLTHENLDAMVIRLPSGHLWAFALREPYGRCNLEFVTDSGQLAKQYGFRASHPMVASPCTNTVYDPLKVGPLGGDVWVRGEIVQGSGLRPPISIDVEEKGSSIIADRIE
jgi:hypothetical protein